MEYYSIYVYIIIFSTKDILKETENTRKGNISIFFFLKKKKKYINVSVENVKPSPSSCCVFFRVHVCALSFFDVLKERIML